MQDRNRNDHPNDFPAPPAMNYAEAEIAQPRENLWQRANHQFTAWLDRRTKADPRHDRNQLAMGVGAVAGTVLCLVAPDAAHQMVETIQTHGTNFTENPSLGEWVTVGLAGGIGNYALNNWIDRRAAARQEA